MRHKILAALGVLAVITGLASSAHAQSAVVSNPETGKFTSSDASVVEIESRSVAEDYKTFFGEGNPSATSLNNGGADTSADESKGNFEVSDQVELLVNEPFAPEVNPLFSNQAERFDGLDRVEVQYELTE